ncbi:MAG TPA: penicillin-binding transpeptidase domain-containing protein, partial [Pseudonocardiaceae bacterium]|nr:penicillin-binding transpeptidase domain-containing protein [Pseudonocardiaceae bacterium]
SADPQTGEIIAWYGGDDPKQTEYDMAATPHQPGSSFKPYVFAGALETDPSQVGLDAIYDGSNNQNINGHIVHNSEGEGTGPTNVKTAMTQSINTVFYNMGIDEGIKNVQTAAYQAGIPQEERASYLPGDPMAPTLVDLDASGKSTGVIEGGISIGQYMVTPRDQAQGYATLANYGNKIPLHFVDSVVNSEGGTVFAFARPAAPAFSSDEATSQSISHTVIDSMTGVASADKLSLAGNRPVAAKTGTQGYNDPVTQKALTNSLGSADSDAWMVGFTPSVVTSVWFGHSDRVAPIYGNYNNTESPSQKGYPVYGHDDPGLIWKNYMDSVLGSSPQQQFAPFPDIQGAWNFMTKSPVSQGQPQSQSNSPSNPAGGGGTSTTTSTTEPTTSESETTTETSPVCGLTCGPGGGGGGHGGGGQPTLPGG